jgi:dUTP pyrophosphatase
MTTELVLNSETVVGVTEKRKRFYKVGEFVFIKTLRKTGKIVSLDTKNLEAVLTVKEGTDLVPHTIQFKFIDKLKKREVDTEKEATTNSFNASSNGISVSKQRQPWQKKSTSSTQKERVYKKGNANQNSISSYSVRNVLKFAKVRPDAIIPSKNFEDAGYDIYANFEGDEITLKKGTVNLVATGIASAMSPDYYLNFKHERSSTGKYGLATLSGVIDSGYRGEIFINLIPLVKDIIISKTYKFPVNEKNKQVPVEFKGHTYYPYSLAIVQATLDLVPDVDVQEVTYDALKAIPSVRGTGAMGSSGK